MSVQTEGEAQTADAAPSLGDQLQEMEENLHLFWDRLQTRDQTMRSYQTQAAELSKRLAELKARTEAIKTRLRRSPRRTPPPIAAAPAPLGQIKAPVRGPSKFAAYAALAAAALILDFHGAPAREGPKPVRAAPAPAAAPKSPPQAVERDDDSDAALKLVYLFRLPGRKETVLDLLGYKDDDMLNASPWQVERLDRDTYLVTYKAPGGEPAYHFEVDVGARSVYVQPDTQRQLLASDG